MRNVSAAGSLVCLVLVSATCFGVCGEGMADERVGEVDELFARYDSTHTPGAALAVIQDGEVIYALEVVDSELHVRVGHTIDEVLQPLARDSFEAVDWVQLEFVRDPEGGITGFELETERATGLIFTRQQAGLEQLDGRGRAAADVEGRLGRP
jgi:hypothetical protein